MVNINGVTKKDDLKANEILAELEDHEREELVRRLFNPTDNYLRDMHPTAFVKHALDVSLKIRSLFIGARSNPILSTEKRKALNGQIFVILVAINLFNGYKRHK